MGIAIHCIKTGKTSKKTVPNESKNRYILSSIIENREKKVKIGLLGTGLMGQPMALKLLEAKLSVIAYNRTESKLAPLGEAGVEIADSPIKAIEAADCLILMLTDKAAIQSIILSEPARSALANKAIIQMGTISPEESKAIRDQVVSAEGEYLEAPVLGSIPQVKTGELLVMVGATEQQFNKYYKLFQHFSPEPIHVGDVGTAAAMKLALNQLIAGLTATFALSLSFVRHQGVEIEQFMEVLRQSALYAPTFDKKLPRMLEGNFANPNFPTKHLLKDTNLFLNQAKEMGLNTSSLEGVRAIVEKAIVLGFGEDDYSSLFAAIDSYSS